MTAYTIDTLATARELQEAGFKTEQAEAVVKAIAHQGDQLATKADIAGVRQEVAGVRQEITGVRWTFGILFGFQSALTLLILARVFDFIGAPGQ